MKDTDACQFCISYESHAILGGAWAGRAARKGVELAKVLGGFDESTRLYGEGLIAQSDYCYDL